MKFVCSGHGYTSVTKYLALFMISQLLALLSCRRCSLEKKLADADVSEEEVNNILKQFEKKETEYMRLQRHKMSVDDFDLLTMIGKGAFGEVNLSANMQPFCIPLSLFYWNVSGKCNGFLLGQSLQREVHRKRLCNEEA
jgi:hypothetical protein